MKVPHHRRSNPKNRMVGPAPAGTNLQDVAEQARYTGSPYHKDVPSFAGRVPRPRPDASICPRELAWRQAQVNDWLREAIRRGWFSGSWRNGFPDRVWIRVDGVVYEARRTNAGTGEYKGYPLEADQPVKGLP